MHTISRLIRKQTPITFLLAHARTRTATGDSWVKTDRGWLRKTNPVMERKSTLSAAELSVQAYEALELRFGLRRSRSTDFDLAVRCLTVLVDIYCVRGGRSLQNAIMRDVGVALKTFLRFPQSGSSVLLLIARCRVAFEVSVCECGLVKTFCLFGWILIGLEGDSARPFARRYACGTR